MKKHLYMCVAISALLSISVEAKQDIKENIDEIIVRSSYTKQLLSDMNDVVSIIGGAEILDNGSKSLGASMSHLLGATYSDYGSAVGQPVIRGLAGNRLKVLNNGIVVRDITGLGVDHINEVDMNNIQQIEIVKGPSSLLYANGSVGGIINVVDNTIARSDVVGETIRVSQELHSVNGGNVQSASYQGMVNQYNISVAWKDAQFGEYDLPTGALLPEDPPHDEDLSVLKNSDHGTMTTRLGVSRTGEWGYLGLSFQEISGVYGIPFHGDGHEDEVVGANPDDERIMSVRRSQVFTTEGAFNVKSDWIDSIAVHYRNNDYTLVERHDDGAEAPTYFTNKADEFGVVVSLPKSLTEQKIIANIASEDLTVRGAESYMEPSASDEMSLGYFLGVDLASLYLDFGIRYDDVTRKGSITENAQSLPIKRTFNNIGYAASLSTDASRPVTIKFGLARVARAPSATELLMNGPHLVSQRFEVGNVNLRSERSDNLDLTVDYRNRGYYGSASYYRNNINNYIYLQDETDAEHAAHGAEDAHGDLIRANYLQKDAKFHGYEIEIGKTFDLNGGALTLSLGRDVVYGKFSNGLYIPRLSPSRNIYTAEYIKDAFTFKALLKNVSQQSRLASSETATPSHQMLDLNLTQSFVLHSGADLQLTFFANNVFDEVARNHTSAVKDDLPLPGRNLGVGVHLTF